MSYKIDTRKEHQVFFKCRREVELLKKEMEECGYTGKIVVIEPAYHSWTDLAPRIRVVVTHGFGRRSWNAIIARVRSQTVNRRYSTNQVDDALEEAGIDDDKREAVLKILYPDIYNDWEFVEDWEDEEWFNNVTPEEAFKLKIEYNNKNKCVYKEAK